MTYKQSIKRIGFTSGAIILTLSSMIGATLALSESVYAAPIDTVYVATNGVDNTDCIKKSQPCATINHALSQLTAGGTVHVADGTYSQGISISNNINPVTILGNANPDLVGGAIINLPPTNSTYGIDVENSTGVTIKGLHFSEQSETSLNYSLHAYRDNNLTIQRDTFNNPGGNKSGGVDINSSQNVLIQNVTADGFHKNGISITAQYASTDTPSANITLRRISTTNNSWAGLAFYTVSGSGNGAANITGVTFSGTNTITGNTGQGLFIEGDSDANLAIKATPAHTVTGPAGANLVIRQTTITGNGTDVLNYQTMPIEFGSNTIGNTII